MEGVRVNLKGSKEKARITGANLGGSLILTEVETFKSDCLEMDNQQYLDMEILCIYCER